MTEEEYQDRLGEIIRGLNPRWNKAIRRADNHALSVHRRAVEEAKARYEDLDQETHNLISRPAREFFDEQVCEGAGRIFDILVDTAWVHEKTKEDVVKRALEIRELLGGRRELGFVYDWYWERKKDDWISLIWRSWELGSGSCE